MKERITAVMAVALVLLYGGGSSISRAAQFPVVTPGQDIVAFAGESGSNEEFTTVVSLSDGSFLVGGRCENVSWLPSHVDPVEISAQGANSSATGSIAFCMQLASDLSYVKAFVHFPVSTLYDVCRIRTTNVPGDPTGQIYISGHREGVSDDNNDASTSDNEGYYIASLNNNFVDGIPDGIDWIRDINCPPREAGAGVGTSAYKELQPWDVASDGSVIYGRGAEYDWNWAVIEKLDSNGSHAVVPYWRTHWADSGEFGGTIDEYDGSGGVVRKSGIVLKAGRGSLRSWNDADYNLIQHDGNGGYKKGKWPMDYFFSGPKGSGGDGGYTGYKKTGKMTARLGAIVIDRRNDHLYFGISTQSTFYDTAHTKWQPDFEPTVIAMDNEGELKWWSRLYHEFIDLNGNREFDADREPALSSPDQYVDALGIDYDAPSGGALVVVGRCHGNNTINFWRGNKIEYDDNPGWSYQEHYTGTNGNAHYSWIGRFSLDDEEIRHSTYVGELNEGENPGGSYDYSLLEGWYNLNSGWPDMNTTRIEYNDISIDNQGNIYVAAVGRRTMTTTNAYQHMPRPSQGHSSWNEFVRVYRRDLTLPRYCSMLTAPWDITNEQRSEGTDITSLCAAPGALIAVGKADVNTHARALPSANEPGWSIATPNDQEQETADGYSHLWDGMVAKLSFSNQVSMEASERGNYVRNEVDRMRLVQSKRKLHLFFRADKACDISLDICDAQGRVHTAYSGMSIKSGSNHLQLDKAGMVCGWYVVRVRTSSGTYRRKVVITQP